MAQAHFFEHGVDETAGLFHNLANLSELDSQGVLVDIFMRFSANKSAGFEIHWLKNDRFAATDNPNVLTVTRNPLNVTGRSNVKALSEKGSIEPIAIKTSDEHTHSQLGHGDKNIIAHAFIN